MGQFIFFPILFQKHNHISHSYWLKQDFQETPSTVRRHHLTFKKPRKPSSILHLLPWYRVHTQLLGIQPFCVQCFPRCLTLTTDWFLSPVSHYEVNRPREAKQSVQSHKVQAGTGLDSYSFFQVQDPVLCLVGQLCLTLCNPRLLCPWGFSRQDYWSGLLCPPFPNPGIKPRSPTLEVDSTI